MTKKTIAGLIVAVFMVGIALALPMSVSHAEGNDQGIVNKERMLTEFLDLVKIDSMSKNEREIIDYIKPRLAQVSTDVFEDNAGEKYGGNAGNVFALIKGNVDNAPVLMLNAHVDTVGPSKGVKPEVADGIIKSSGDTVLGADDKAGVSAILEALRTLKENNLPHGDILVVFTVAEDVGLFGSKNMDMTLIKKADFGFSLDGDGNPGDIIVSAPGHDRIEVAVYGKAAHAGLQPEAGLNAIVLAGKALAEIKQGRIDPETTANIGIISGGKAFNIVPDRVDILCEARSRNVTKLDQQTAHMTETFKRVVTANGGRVEIVVDRTFAPFAFTADNRVVGVAKKAGEAIGLSPKLMGSGGGSDANIFNGSGVPIVVLGVGKFKTHSTSEFIKEADLYKSGDLVVSIIQTVAQMKK